MKIRIKNAIEFVKYSEDTIEADLNAPISELISNIKDKYKPKIENLRYSITRGSEFKVITDFSKTLASYNFKENDSFLVEATSVLEVPTYLVTVISYLGPPLIFLYFLISHYGKLDYLKVLSVILVNAHFFRRIYESTFIFQTGRQALSIMDLVGVTLYYYILNGVVIGYSIFTTDFSNNHTPFDYLKTVVLTLIFFFCERGNSSCHIYLANIKKLNNGQRGIPQGGMFDYVTCAHYFWELMSWITFSFIYGLYSCYLFALFSLLSMGFLALDKHRSMKIYFGDKYPKDKKAFIPFIL